MCECDAAAVVPAPDILLFDGRVLHAKLTYRILVQLVQATARYLLSRILYYIIITRISVYPCVCVCVCTFYLGTPPKGRRINPRARVHRNPPRTARTSDGHDLPTEKLLSAEQESTGSRCPGRLRACADCNKIVRVHKPRAVRPRSLRRQYYTTVLVYNIGIGLPLHLTAGKYVILLLYRLNRLT